MIREKPSKWRMVILGMLILLFIGILAYAFLRAPLPGGSITMLADGWTVTTPDGTDEDVALSQVDLDDVREGDRFVLTRTLPEEEVSGACIMIQTIHCSINVQISGRPVYADGTQYPIRKQMTPSRFYFVSLPAKYNGKELRIELIAASDTAFSGFTPIYIGSIDELYLYYLNSYRLMLLISIFLVMTGVLMIFLFFFLWIYYRRETRIFYSGLMVFFIGLYLLCFHELPEFINSTVEINDFLEYVSLYILPFVTVSFVASLRPEGSDRKIMRLMALLDLAAVGVAVILHLTNLVHFDAFVSLSHLVIITEAVILIVLAVKSIRAKRDVSGELIYNWTLSDRILLWCFIVMIILSSFDIFRYISLRYLAKNSASFTSLTFLMLGTLVFVGGLFLNFFYYHIERVSADTTVSHLSGLAYTDPLTGMANRSRCETLLNDLNGTEDGCTVVSMDVDHLKQINDTFGHSTGDKYLVDMAGFLRDAFPDALLLGRMGGDEFIAVLKGMDREKFKACAKHLNGLVKAKNASGSEIHYGISYGAAYTYETTEHTLEAAMEIADARMYEMKRIRHAQEGRA